VSENDPEHADSREAARHMRIVTSLVLEYALLVDHNREFGEPMERIAAWREARARVLGVRPGTVAEFGAAGGLGPSALLRELVEGMRAAAESHPEVARVLSLSRSWPSDLSVADQAMGQAGPNVTDEVRARRREVRERWARGSGASQPTTPPRPGRSARRQP
jgi:hypothetical protein